MARTDHRDPLAVTPERQRYTRTGEQTYRYWDESGFEAELEVDGNDLVQDYPGLFRRLV